jgi:hypothetical protein
VGLEPTELIGSKGLELLCGNTSTEEDDDDEDEVIEGLMAETDMGGAPIDKDRFQLPNWCNFVRAE